MKVKDLKEWLNLLPDDMDLNYHSEYGDQEITCFTAGNCGLCLSNTPYEVTDLDKRSTDSIVKELFVNKESIMQKLPRVNATRTYKALNNIEQSNLPEIPDFLPDNR